MSQILKTNLGDVYIWLIYTLLITLINLIIFYTSSIKIYFMPFNHHQSQTLDNESV